MFPGTSSSGQMRICPSSRTQLVMSHTGTSWGGTQGSFWRVELVGTADGASFTSATQADMHKHTHWIPHHTAYRELTQSWVLPTPHNHTPHIQQNKYSCIISHRRSGSIVEGDLQRHNCRHKLDLAVIIVAWWHTGLGHSHSLRYQNYWCYRCLLMTH